MGDRSDIKKASVDTGKASFEYIEEVIDLAMNKRIDATVTGPINKEAINLAGFHYAGHTEIYAEFTHTKDYAMIENLGLKLSLLEGIGGLC